MRSERPVVDDRVFLRGLDISLVDLAARANDAVMIAAVRDLNFSDA